MLKHKLDLWLEPIPPELCEHACDALESGDITGFLLRAPNEASLGLVFHNHKFLIGKGLYEEALVGAFMASRVNNHGFPVRALLFMLAIADRERLRAIGDPLPGKGPFTIFRGVAGIGAARRVRGISWTASKEKARWFARRFNLPNPDVYRVTVSEADVLLYTDERKEQEFLVLLRSEHKPFRLPGIQGPTS